MSADDNPGADVVAYVRERMAIDDEWMVEEEDGFRWWGHDTCQRVWSEAVGETEFGPLHRVHVWTDFVDVVDPSPETLRLLGLVPPIATLSGMVVVPEWLRTDDPTLHLSLASCLYVHPQTREWVSELASWVAPIQLWEAGHLSRALVGSGASGIVPHRSSHPESGPRAHPDDMLRLVPEMVAPAGRSPSQWRGAAMREVAEGFARYSRFLTTGDEDGLTVEYPFGETTSLLQIRTGEAHPALGNGCLMTLTLPTRVEGIGKDPLLACVEMNCMELGDPEFWAHFLGSWSPSEMGLTYVCFLPNRMFHPATLDNLSMSMGVRARRIERLFQEGE